MNVPYLPFLKSPYSRYKIWLPEKKKNPLFFSENSRRNVSFFIEKYLWFYKKNNIFVINDNKVI